MALGLNIKKRRVALGLTQGELAKIVGVSQVAIANLERRDSRSSRNLIALADALQCSVRELELGSAVGETLSEYQFNTETVPILNDAQVRRWQQEMNNTGISKKPKKSRIGRGKNVFCMRVEGDSMTAQIGVSPSFPEGYYIHADPDIKPKKNDFVIAQMHNDQITFKQLKSEDGKNYLKAINPEFGVTFDDFSIIAVVIGASLDL